MADCLRPLVHAANQHFDLEEVAVSKLVPVEEVPELELVPTFIQRQTSTSPNVTGLIGQVLVNQALNVR